MLEINGYQLECTCSACPEQYDVYKNGEAVGYLRLRHGHFRAEYNRTIVYEADTEGDGLFEENEREFHLTMAIIAIDIAMNSEGSNES